MRLPRKSNPRATPRSTLLWGLGGAGTAAAGYPIVGVWEPFLREHWAWLYPMAIVFVGAVSALVEWQVDD